MTAHPSQVTLDAAIQRAELKRVASRIGDAILEWCTARLATAPEFHMHDLEAAVRERLGGAPDSASRILRSLRQRGALAYVVVNRSASLYRIVSAGDVTRAA